MTSNTLSLCGNVLSIAAITIFTDIDRHGIVCEKYLTAIDVQCRPISHGHREFSIIDAYHF